MITKGKIWKKIRIGLREIDRSSRLTRKVMETIRNLEREANTTTPPKTD